VHLLAALLLALGGPPAVSADAGIPTVRWSLAAGEYVSNVEIALGPDVHPPGNLLLSGSFRHAVYSARLYPGATPPTSFTPLPFRGGMPLANGTYYAHVHYVSGCSSWDRCSHDAWSATASFTVTGSATPRRAGAPNELSVRAVRVSGRVARVRLVGRFRVAVPDGCPATDPGLGDEETQSRWGSAYCADYTRQRADVTVRAVRAHGVVYSERRPAYGPAWRADLFPALFHGGCKTGPYAWTVTLVDPYYRPDVSVSGSFSARC
jgi:hypothetical protein